MTPATARQEQAATGVDRTDDGRFASGHSGNDRGRPRKDRQLTRALETCLGGKVKSKRRYTLVAEKVVALALAGDMAAIKFLADRTEGLPIQRHIFDPEDIRQQAEALAAETGASADDVETKLKRNLTLVK